MKKAISIALTLLMVMSSVFVVVGEGNSLDSGNAISGMPEEPSPMLTSHAPIRIDSNADFDSTHGVTNGSGTILDPYIIENWTIDGSGVGYGIYIGNTTSYFIIRNCTVQNANGVGSEPYYSDSNIALYNVTNGMVTNVTSTHAANNGIYLLGWSHNNIVYNNTVSSNLYGIVLYMANETRVINNTVWNNGRDGLRMDSARDTFISDLLSTGNNRYGIYLGYSSNTTMESVTSDENSGYECYIDYSDDTSIVNSTFNGYQNGWSYVVYGYYSNRLKVTNSEMKNSRINIIYTYFCSKVLIENSTISNSSSDSGIYSYYTDSFSIRNSTVFNCYHAGIHMYGSRNPISFNNTIWNCTQLGIYSQYNYRTYSIIRNNTIAGSYVGIYLASQNSTVEGNRMFGTGIYVNNWDGHHTIENNTVNGKPVFYAYNTDYLTIPEGAGEVLLNSCDHYTLEGQELSNGTVGIQAYYSQYGRISNNTIRNDHLFGIWLYGSSQNQIVNNSISNSTEYDSHAGGLYMHYSRGNTIEGNTITDSKYGVYLGSNSYSSTFRNNTLLNNGFWIYETNINSIGNEIGFSNTVNGKPVYFLAHQTNFTVPADSAGQVIMGDCENITVESQHIHDSTAGIEIIYSSGITLSDMNIRNEAVDGIYSSYSSHIGVSGASLTSTADYGAYAYYTDNFTMENSSIIDGGIRCVYLYRSPDYTIRNSSFYNASSRIIYTQNSQRGEISGCDIKGPSESSGIYLYSDGSASEYRINDNTITSINSTTTMAYGIYMYRINGADIYNNTASRSYYGLYANSCDDMDVKGNDFVNVGYGMYIYRSSYYEPYIPSKIYYNNFINCWWYDIYLYGTYNDTLNLSYPGGGNYYSDYNGVDYFSGPNQDLAGPDGMGDTPKTNRIQNGVDYYPLIFPYGSTPTSLANSSWPMLNHDIAHTGTTDVNGPPLPIEYWNFSTSDMASSPTIGPDGTIYFGSMNGEFYALNSDSSLKWNYTVGANITSSPAIAEDGTIYFGAVDGTLYALHPNGTLKWNYDSGMGAPSNLTSPAIGTDGTIYIGINDRMYAINDDSSVRWTYTLGTGDALTSPAIGTDGTIYFSRYSGPTYALYPNNGSLKWTYSQPGNMSTAPTVFNDGNSDIILLCSDTGNVSAIASNGTYVGGMDVDGAVTGAATVSSGGIIYVPTDNGTIYSVIPDSGPQWTFHVNASVSGSVAVDSGGNIFFGSTDGKIYALDSSGNELWNFTTDYPLRTSPAIGPGIVLLGGDGGIYCMGDVTPPSIMITAPTDGQVIQSNSVSVAWTGSDAESGIGHYEVKLDDGTWTAVGTNTQHTFSALSDGTHTAYVMAVDNAGNTATDRVDFTVDTYPPTINITAPANNSLLNADHVTVTWTGTDNGTGIEHYELRTDSGSWTNVGTNTSYDLTSLGEGAHSVNIRAFDGTGKNITGSVSFTVDTVSPVLSITSPSDGEVFTVNTVTATWSGFDTTSEIDHYEIMLDTDTPMNVGTNTSYDFTNLEEGAHSVTVTAVDAAGNENTTSVSFTVDTIAPDVSITAPDGGSLQGPDVEAIWQGSDSGTGIAYYLVRLDGGVWINVGTNTSHSFTGLSNGAHTIDVRATDGVGLLNLTSVSFEVDAVAPTVTANRPTGSLVPVDAQIFVTFSEQVNHGSVHLIVRSGDEVVHGTITWNNNTVAFTPNSPLDYATQYEVRVSGATDSVGNVMDNYTWTFTTTNIGTVTGTVLDENGNPVAGATVTADTGESTTTDDGGNFSLDVPMGNHILTISKDGYDDTTVNASVVAGETSPLSPVQMPESKLASSGGIPLVYMIVLIIAVLAVIGLLIAKRKKPEGTPEESKEPAEMPEEGSEAEETLPSEEENIEGGEELEEESF